MKGNQPVLHVCAGTHLSGAAHQDTHLTSAYFCKQFLLSGLCICFMDIGYLFARNSLGNKLFPDIIVNVKIANPGFLCGITQRSSFFFVRCFPARRRQVTENKLSKLLRVSITPDPDDVSHTGIYLAVRIVWQHRVNQPLIQSQFSAVRCYLQHVILAWINRTAMHLCSAFREGRNHLFLILGGVNNHSFVMRFRPGQIQLICGFDIRHFRKKLHQFRQVEKLGESRSCTVAGAFRSQLNSRCSLSEGGCPAVKLTETFLLKRSILQIALHSVKLRH